MFWLSKDTFDSKKPKFYVVITVNEPYFRGNKFLKSIFKVKKKKRSIFICAISMFYFLCLDNKKSFLCVPSLVFSDILPLHDTRFRFTPLSVRRSGGEKLKVVILVRSRRNVVKTA